MAGTEELIKKTLSGSDITGKLIQEVVDKVVVNLANYENPLRQNLPRRAGVGDNYVFNRRTASTSAGAAIADTGSFSDQEGSYTKVSLPYKIYGTSLKVTKFAQAAGRNYIDVLESEASAKMEEFTDWEEQAIIWGNYISGDSFTDTTFADGLVKQIVFGGDGNITLLGTDDTGADLTISDLDTTIDKIYGGGNLMILCSRKGRRIISALLQAQQRFINETEIAGGFKVMTYAGIPVLPTTSIPDTLAYDYDGATTNTYVSARTGGTTTMFLIVNLSDAFVAELESLHTVQVASTSSQYDQYDVYEFATPVVKKPTRHAVIFGCTG